MKTLNNLLWDTDDGDANFFVFDGAASDNLLDRLYGEVRPEFECLFEGTLAPDMAEVAPYLIRLDKPNSEFEQWLQSGWGLNWGIFIQLPKHTELHTVKHHLRKITKFYNHEVSPNYFRFYDPRVLPLVLPVCTHTQLAEIFGPIKRMIMESKPDNKRVLIYSLFEDTLQRKAMPLG